MRNQLQENKEFNIISRSIDNACKCCVQDVKNDYFSVKLQKKVKYEPDESVELFTMTPKGQLYFETLIKDVKDDILSIWFPITYKYIQRREYTRIDFPFEVILKSKSKKVEAHIEDISAGGMKVSASEPLNLLTEYKFILEIEQKHIKTVFEPIRTEVIQNKFISSGRFKEITNYDRIALVQYCFKKQMENSNK